MDSIERMRRINDLTRELKQHGFAESSFEAIRQANQIYGSDDLDDDVKQGLIKSSTHDRMSNDEQVVKDENMSDENVAYNDRKLAKVADTVQVLTDKMNEIIRALNDLDARISDVKIKQDKMTAEMRDSRAESRSEISRIESRSSSTPSSTTASSNNSVAEKPISKEVSEAKVESHEAPKDEYSMNQRTGNFQSQDVAIDKMFYFGNKK